MCIDYTVYCHIYIYIYIYAVCMYLPYKEEIKTTTTTKV